MIQAPSIRDIVERTPDLPSIPAAAVNVLRQTSSENATANQIAETLGQDQALSARVLRLANSAFYGLTRQIGNLPQAVVVLGMRNVRNLAIVAATYGWMARPVPGYGLGPRELWVHAFGTGLGARLVAAQTKRCDPSTAFTAGLLHDVGKVAMSLVLDGKMGAVLAHAARKGLTFDEAERAVLGFDHTEVGLAMAEEWNLPAEILSAIRWHHHPADAESDRSVVDAVHIGNYLTMAMGFGLGGDGLHYAFDEDALVRLGLAPDQMDGITEEFVAGYEEYEGIFAGYAA